MLSCICGLVSGPPSLFGVIFHSLGGHVLRWVCPLSLGSRPCFLLSRFVPSRSCIPYSLFSSASCQWFFAVPGFCHWSGEERWGCYFWLPGLSISFFLAGLGFSWPGLIVGGRGQSWVLTSPPAPWLLVTRPGSLGLGAMWFHWGTPTASSGR